MLRSENRKSYAQIPALQRSAMWCQMAVIDLLRSGSKICINEMGIALIFRRVKRKSKYLEVLNRLEVRKTGEFRTNCGGFRVNTLVSPQAQIVQLNLRVFPQDQMIPLF